MNKYQRSVLIGAGLAIAAYQVYGIAENGLYESRGWAVSFLIAAALLFVGLGDWGAVLARIRGKSLPPSVPPSPQPARETPRPAAPSNPKPTTKPEPPKSGKYDYGIHILELDLAIRGMEIYAGKFEIFHPLRGNGRGLKWNACAMIYAAMRYAALKGNMNIHNMKWNTIVKCVVVRMTTEGDDGIPMGDVGHEQLEAAAYRHLEQIDRAVSGAMAGEGSYALAPVVDFLASGFGARGDAVKAVAGGLGAYIEKAHAKILPELLEDFS